MRSEHLLALARASLEGGSGRPSQAALCRAVSTAYYAMFHALARNCADLLIGKTPAARNRQAWSKTYRSLEHGRANAACANKKAMAQFPRAIRNFGGIFTNMQSRRHQADYDPSARFTKLEVMIDIDRVARAIVNFDRLDNRDKRAFCAHVLFRPREP